MQATPDTKIVLLIDDARRHASAPLDFFLSLFFCCLRMVPPPVVPFLLQCASLCQLLQKRSVIQPGANLASTLGPWFAAQSPLSSWPILLNHLTWLLSVRTIPRDPRNPCAAERRWTVAGFPALVLQVPSVASLKAPCTFAWLDCAVWRQEGERARQREKQLEALVEAEFSAQEVRQLALWTRRIKNPSRVRMKSRSSALTLPLHVQARRNDAEQERVFQTTTGTAHVRAPVEKSVPPFVSFSNDPAAPQIAEIFARHPSVLPRR